LPGQPVFWCIRRLAHRTGREFDSHSARRVRSRSVSPWLHLSVIPWALRMGPFADDRGAAAGVAVDSEGGTNHAGTIIHNAESHAGGFVHAFWEAYAIVVHGQRGAVLSSRQGQDNVARLPMFNGVTHGFLRNAIEMRGACMVRRGRQAVTRHPTGDAKEAL